MSVTKRSAAVVANLRSIRFPRTPGSESRHSGFVSGERDEFGFVLGFVGFVFGFVPNRLPLVSITWWLRTSFFNIFSQPASVEAEFGFALGYVGFVFGFVPNRLPLVSTTWWLRTSFFNIFFSTLSKAWHGRPARVRQWARRPRHSPLFCGFSNFESRGQPRVCAHTPNLHRAATLPLGPPAVVRP